MSNDSIYLEDVCFSYDSALILKNLSMKISGSRICFIMGNNGSGKTTLLKNMMGFLSPQRGKILIGGREVSSIDRRTLSKLISYVPQAIHLNTDFSVIDYLILGRTPHIGINSKLSKKDYEIVDKFSDMLGIVSIYDIPFNKLSGGQKQTVAIARSLIQDTPLIIMDEPMSALDIGKQVDLLRVLTDLAKEGKTIVLTTHNPNHAIAIDSDACFLQDGEIAAFGKSSDVIQDELLRQIYGDYISLDHGEKTDAVVFNTRSFQ